MSHLASPCCRTSPGEALWSSQGGRQQPPPLLQEQCDHHHHLRLLTGGVLELLPGGESRGVREPGAEFLRQPTECFVVWEERLEGRGERGVSVLFYSN